MTELLPFDLTDMLHAELDAMRRSPDGLLHPSTHLSGPLRHAQLDMAGAPQNRRPLVDEVVLMTGTLWHEVIGAMLKRLGLPVMMEVNLTPWLPEGWSGTADLIVWNPALKAWVLVDIKTTKGESIRWIERDGAKDDHVLQTSSYWWALKAMGLPLVKKVCVYYLPKNDIRGGGVEPLLVDFDPVPKTELTKLMRGRGKSITGYLESLPERDTPPEPDDFDYWLTDELVDPPEPEQRLYFNRTSGMYDVKLQRHWSADYCSFPTELCPCSLAPKTTLIGAYDKGGDYLPRKGYEHIEPEVEPEPQEF